MMMGYKWVLLMFSLCACFHDRFCISQGFQGNSTNASFVFGDSLVDAGNNNYLTFSLSKANYIPNGVDFPSLQASGRYTNGRTILDIVGQGLGQQVLPPFMAPSTEGSVIVQAGVNYGSGGSGILPETGRIFGLHVVTDASSNRTREACKSIVQNNVKIQRISMDEQLRDFSTTLQELNSMLGVAEAQEFLQRSMFSVTMGSNDFLDNYLLPGSRTQSPENFITMVLERYRKQLYKLYTMGARKIVVANVGPIGCVPYQRAINAVYGADGCVDFPNRLAKFYNSGLKLVLAQLNSVCPGATFVYANTYDIVADIIANHTNYGFEYADRACCGAGRFKGLIPCGPQSEVCSNRSQYVFWDPYHPTEAANLIIANRLLDGGPDTCFPVNIRTLYGM